MGQRVRITDVSPRDGLQNEAAMVAAADKARLVGLLCASGVDEVEVSSFVSAKWVPQLGDAAEVFAMVAEGTEISEPISVARPMLSALVPNEKGLEGALEVNKRAGRKVISKVSVFTAASETFSRKNTNASIAETLKRFEPVVARAHAEGLLVRGYVSCAFECPFEGKIEPSKVAQVAQALHDMGCDEIDLGDTIGAAEPATVMLLIHGMLSRLGDGLFEYTTLHLHDTYGRAAACVEEALSLGVRSFDGAVAGLGGCPYATREGRRAPGNISTELLVRTVRDAGFECGVEAERLREAGVFAEGLVGGGDGGLKARPTGDAR
jgi:hydroxymethylglutaryl-CoA lyase